MPKKANIKCPSNVEMLIEPDGIGVGEAGIIDDEIPREVISKREGEVGRVPGASRTFRSQEQSEKSKSVANSFLERLEVRRIGILREILVVELLGHESKVLKQ